MASRDEKENKAPGGFQEIDILRYKGGKRISEKDRVVEEVPLTIFLNQREFVTLLCSPGRYAALAVGFLRSEGLIESSADLRGVRVEESTVYVDTSGGTELVEKLYGKRTITSGCGKGTVFFNVLDSLRSKPVESSLKVRAGILLDLMSEMHEGSRLFRETGGVHSAALADGKSLLFSCEDIGRHNAVDKIVGECILNDVELGDKILLSSGRLSSEIVIKGAKLEVPFIVSRAAPTFLSVELASNLGVTLVGFARGRRLNVYTHDHRIVEE